VNKKQINMSKKRVDYIPIGPEENLIFQPYLIIELLFNLKKHNFIGSDYFKKMKYNEDTRDLLKKAGIDNQGLIMLSLYALLVIPKEILEKKDYDPDFEKINKKISDYFQNTETNYGSDTPNTNYTRHLRNALSHGRISFIGNSHIEFKDEKVDKKKVINEFKSEINLKNVGNLIDDLQKLIIGGYLEYLKKNN
jgi:hypothetical protein